MKNRDFDSLKRATAYLVGTVIRLGKTPIYIQQVTEGRNKKTSYVLKYNEVGAKEVHTVNLGHPKINMNPVKLGWLSCRPGSIYNSAYLSRKPNRTWHVGFCLNNMQIGQAYDNGYLIACSNYKTSAFLMWSKELRDTILGKYPSFEEAKTYAAKEKERFWPFSREWAIFGEKVFYKYITHPVGKLENGTVVLNEPASTVLMEVLNEALHGK
jgi:hypothetical protein